ncbi:hypothetical protein CDL15_Pgr025579 [Punica granatum]|uniref:Uncharacterized protein n=1 Tax=Punica granatum TaxID=22663 RepID=A0A218WBK4_PUNGR|nr:hypothetical protein CDL15_Pgr025579 [Punica granatum]PKI68159.1 hypothetical protein CRG98_011458 [Punica granatum]
MSVIDIIARLDAICKKYDCKKYDRYDVEEQTDVNFSDEDSFARLYAVLEADIGAAQQTTEVAPKEKTRASAVAINVDARPNEDQVLEKMLKLQRLVMQKVKGLSSEEFAARNDLLFGLTDRIQGIGDGTACLNKWRGGWAASSSQTGF